MRSVEHVSAKRCCIPYTVIEIFDCNCNDRELGGFKVIQGQRSWCQSIAHPIYLTSFESNIVSLTVFEILDINDIFP